jgi:single-strand DNA-binding protein
LNGLLVACTGCLGGDPEEKYTRDGKPMLVFSIAVDENITATEARAAPDTTWLRCTAWEQQAETLGDVLRKGVSVYVEGRLRHGTWETQDGERRCGLSVSCWTVQPLGQIGRRAPRRNGQRSVPA